MRAKFSFIVFLCFCLSLCLAVNSYPPDIGVLPAAVDGVRTPLLLCQLALFVHVGSSHQLHPQTETLSLGQLQSF